MPKDLDPVPDLAALIWAVAYGDRSAIRRVEALLPRLGIGENDSIGAAAIEAGLRNALGPAASGADAELAEVLRDVYVCTRLWEAWQVGTMTEGDFDPAAESIGGDLTAWRDAAVREALAAGLPPAGPDAFPLTCAWCKHAPATHLMITDTAPRDGRPAARHVHRLCAGCAHRHTYIPPRFVGRWLFQLVPDHCEETR